MIQQKIPVARTTVICSVHGDVVQLLQCALGENASPCDATENVNDGNVNCLGNGVQMHMPLIAISFQSNVFIAEKSKKRVYRKFKRLKFPKNRKESQDFMSTRGCKLFNVCSK